MKATANPEGTVPPVSEPKGTSLDIPESSDKGSKKTKGKPFCYRCRTKGLQFTNALLFFAVKFVLVTM